MASSSLAIVFKLNPEPRGNDSGTISAPSVEQEIFEVSCDSLSELISAFRGNRRANILLLLPFSALPAASSDCSTRSRLWLSSSLPFCQQHFPPSWGQQLLPTSPIVDCALPLFNLLDQIICLTNDLFRQLLDFSFAHLANFLRSQSDCFQ